MFSQDNTSQEFTTEIAGCKVSVIINDIVLLKAGAYCVAHYSDDVAEGGLAECIRRNTGRKDSFDEYEKAIEEHGNFKFGDVQLIKAKDNGNADYYFNMAIVGNSRQDYFRDTRKAIITLLHMAEENNIGEIILPAPGTGATSPLEYDQSAKMAASAIHEFCINGGKVPKITFCLPDDKDDPSKAMQNYFDFVETLNSPEKYIGVESEIGKKDINYVTIMKELGKNTFL